MTTRREFAQGSLAALLAAFFATMGNEAPVQSDELEPVPFNRDRHEQLAIVTVISAGFRSSGDGLHPVLSYLFFDEPMAPEDEWMRDACRQELYALLTKLEA